MNIYIFNHIFDKYIPLSIVIMVNSLIDYSSVQIINLIINYLSRIINRDVDNLPCGILILKVKNHKPS